MLLAIAVLVMAVVVQLGRQVAPMVSENKASIEAYFSERIGGHITSETLTLNWSGLLPELRFTQLKLQGPDNNTVLSVRGAVATLDFLGSLYNLSPKIWKLHLDGVSMQLTQDDQERWYLTVPRDAATDATSSASVTPLDAIFTARDVLLNDVVIRYHFLGGRQHAFNFNEISLQNHAGFHRLNAAMDLPEQKNALNLLLEGEGDPGSWREFSGSAYLQINNYQLRDSVAIASRQIAVSEGVVNTRLNADLWLDFVPGEPLILKGTLQAMRPGGGKFAALPSWLDTNIWGSLQGADDWRLQLQSLQFENDFHTGSGIDLAIEQRSGDQVTVYAPELDLGFWAQLAQSSGLLPERLETVFETLQLHGYARDLLVQIPRDQPAEFSLQANLQDVGANAWKGSPQVSGLKGFLQLDKNSGSVQIDSDDYFLMHYPKVYTEPFEFYSAQGEVAWQYDRDANEVFINSGLLKMDGDIGKVRGYFLMDTPFVAKSRLSDLTLQIGLQDSKAVNQRYLVPYTSPQSLRDWLDSAIQGGDVSQAGFFYRGSVAKGDLNRTMQLGLSVENGQLDYSPGWPHLKNFDTELVVDDRNLYGAVAKAGLMGSQLTAAEVSMMPNPSGVGSLLNITGNLRGPAQDLLTVLTETPLQKALGDGFSQWQMQGDMKAQLQLGIPLTAGQPGMTQDIAVTLRDVDLAMQDTGLTVESLSGDLHYSDKAGLAAKQLQGFFWQRPLDAVIETQVSASDGAKETRIYLMGEAEMADLANWSRRPEIKFTEGVTSVGGVVSIPFGGAKDKQGPGVRLELGTDLRGVAVNLPEPFAKSDKEAAPLSFRMDIGKAASRYRLNYREQIQTDLLARKGQPLQGEVALLGKPEGDGRDGLFVTGELARLDEKELFEFIDRYQGYSDDFADGSNTTSGAATLLQFDAQVEEFVWGKVTLDDLVVAGGQVSDGWLFKLENPWFKGDLGLHGQAPIRVDLDYLHIPDFADDTVPQPGATDGNSASSQAQVRQEDLLKDLDLKQIQAMDVSVREVTLAGGELGQWQFKVRPVDNGVELQDIRGEVRGARLFGPVKDSGASLLWLADGNGHRSRFNGVIEAVELGHVMQQWRQPKLLESKRARMRADLSWQGSPVAMNLVDLYGKVNIDVNKGRFIRNSENAESALLRLIGLFNFDSWVRRLQLDFSDVYKSGLAFDKIEGEAIFDQGMLLLERPLVVETPSSELQMGGEINLRKETLDASLVATLPVGGNATTAAAFFAGLPVAASVYLVSKLLDKQIKKLTSISYKIEGPWASPEVEFDRLFDSNAAKKAGKKVRQKSAPPVVANPDASAETQP
ncbi:MAG: YhdP family protein [Candidatus Pelagadaptatus aseana]